MGAGTLMIFAFLPWLDRSPVKSIRYRGPLTKILLSAWIIGFFILGFLGTKDPAYKFFGSIPGAPCGPTPQRLLLPVLPDDADLVPNWIVASRNLTG
jgi:quinol-cytochrome oxidoreductase complex cytochrome b subunit